MKTKKFTPKDVAKIAKLARIPVTLQEEKQLADGFNATMNVVDQLFKVDVGNVEPTSHVTGSMNVFREDDVDVTRTFTQEQALLNAKRTHNGFFVVDHLLEE
ncbi:Asp-tRNA(Asn)/Glu-tRNA(Gln) amidotransferase subunit GatC [Candidatus Gottesmanbacteria bacterium]|nr:Asp-tRNA(Asn)/Glu-tRNA(Gln) amidotransferase subunit GatC [Candidatus Gottesmanbacteria bacterium]